MVARTDLLQVGVILVDWIRYFHSNLVLSIFVIEVDQIQFHSFSDIGLLILPVSRIFHDLSDLGDIHFLPGRVVGELVQE